MTRSLAKFNNTRIKQLWKNKWSHQTSQVHLLQSWCHFYAYRDAGVSSLGVLGVPWLPQILADQLTLSQPGTTREGKLYPPHHYSPQPPGFSHLPTALYGTYIANKNTTYINTSNLCAIKYRFLCIFHRFFQRATHNLFLIASVNSSASKIVSWNI